MNVDHVGTVQLLVWVAPLIFESPCFAMKGGTALNLFVQNLPRLSVDIDLTFVDGTLPRDAALQMIGEELGAAAARLEAAGLRATLRKSRDGSDAKLFISDGVREVKAEVNCVFRGTAMTPVRAGLSAAAQRLFAVNIEVPLLATPELYGSKLVAALDRQHPRDLFDVQLMYACFGLPPAFVDCFVVYLAGHHRPVHEVLFPNPRDIGALFDAEFSGMTQAEVSIDALIATRRRLFAELPAALSARHRAFLLSLVRAEPDWSLLPFARASALPALQWKLMNLRKLRRNRVKFEQQAAMLTQRFDQLH
jgi:hypothetical protein